MAIKKNKSQEVALAKQLIAGTAKHLPGTVVLGGSSYTPAEITAKLQSLIDLRADVDAAKATTKTKLTAEAAVAPSVRALMGALATYVKVTHGSSADVLADFGIHPKARAPVTVETKAVALAKRKATRSARHTMGPRQREEIQGDVTGVVLTPIVSAPVTPAPSSPSVPAPSGNGTRTA